MRNAYERFKIVFAILVLSQLHVTTFPLALKDLAPNFNTATRFQTTEILPKNDTRIKEVIYSTCANPKIHSISNPWRLPVGQHGFFITQSRI